MASEWAAMAMVPKGATMRVLTTYAPPISMCCNPIGAPILKAVLTVSDFGLNDPGRPTKASIFDFTNRKYPEEDFTGKSFSAYGDYESTTSLDAVESTLCAEIIDKIVEDIFNATVAQW